MWAKLRFKQGGFSFFGVLLLMMTLAMFTASLFVSIQPAESTKNLDVTYTRADTLQAAIIKYRQTNSGNFPANLDALVQTTGTPCAIVLNQASAYYKTVQGWCGPYIDRSLAGAATEFKTDGWGVLFQLSAGILRSCGPDKTCGNADDITISQF